MKNILLIALVFTSTVYSQGGDRIKAFKAAHITNALNLTSAEAEKFWPVYNAHEEKMMALRRKERREIFQIVKGDMDGLTEKEAKARAARSADQGSADAPADGLARPDDQN